jgi:hypothetical protein
MLKYTKQYKKTAALHPIILKLPVVFFFEWLYMQAISGDLIAEACVVRTSFWVFSSPYKKTAI